MSKLKVYRWLASRPECGPAQNGSRQCEHICATTSFAELARLSGQSMHTLRTYGGVTGNAESIAVAMASPGIVFWKAEHYQKGADGKWHALKT